MQNKNSYEANTEPIPRHPESFSLVALRRKMAEVAMERRSPFDEKNTEVIPVADTSTEQSTNEDVQSENSRADNASGDLAKKPTPAWIQTIDRVNGRK